MKNKGLWLILGFALIIFGITALALQLVGVQWVFLKFLELGGRLGSFLAKLLMIIAGVVIVVFANTDWERERRESGGK